MAKMTADWLQKTSVTSPVWPLEYFRNNLQVLLSALAMPFTYGLCAYLKNEG
jgi:hypothetical protein